MRRMIFVAAIGFVAALSMTFTERSGSVAAEPKPDSKPVSYSRDIKPIFAAKCYACHGPDEGQRKAKLRLDVRESAVKKVIKPGDPCQYMAVQADHKNCVILHALHQQAEQFVVLANLGPELAVELDLSASLASCIKGTIRLGVLCTAPHIR